MDEWEFVQEPGVSSKVAAVPQQSEIVLKEPNHESDDSEWEILHSATTSDATAASFPSALPLCTDFQRLPGWQGEVSSDACLSPASQIIKTHSAQTAAPNDTEADNPMGAEDLPLSNVTPAESSPVKMAASENPAPYGGSENLTESMSIFSDESAILSSSTGKVTTKKQAVDGRMLQAAKSFNGELERKRAELHLLKARKQLAELEQLHEEKRLHILAAMQSGSTGFVQLQADIRQQHAWQLQKSRHLGKEDGLFSMGDIGRVDYRKK